MCRFFFWLFYLSVICGFAQNVKYGEVSKNEVSMSVYSKDSSAGAVMLYDYGEVDSRYSACSYTCHQRIKIFKKEHTDLASKVIRIHQGQSLATLEGASYNLENGQVVKTKLTKELIHTTEEKDYDLVKFSIPNAKEGSIVEFRYTLSSNFYIRLPSWYFQNSIPVRWSEMKFYNIPVNFGWEVQSWFPLAISEESAGDGNYRWAIKDLPAFKDEGFMINRWDYMARINFFFDPPPSIEAGWKEIVRGLKNKDFIRNTNVKFLDTEIDSLVAKHRDSLGLMVACYDFVRKNIRCNEKGTIDCRGLKDVYTEKAGSAAEINLLLCSMLREAGFQSFPVILSTRENGRISKNSYPSKYLFDYMVCNVRLNHKEFYLDASDALRPYDLVSSSILDCEGVVLDKKDISWVKFTGESSASSYACNMLLQLDDKGKITGSAKVTYKGYLALEQRKILREKGKAFFSKAIKSAIASEVSEIKIENEEEVEKSLTVRYKLSFEDTLDMHAATQLINPIHTRLFESNPLPQPSRSYPMDFNYPFEYSFSISLGFPENMKLASAPDDLQMRTSDNSLSYGYSTMAPMPTAILIKSKWTLKNSYFTADKYPQIKEVISKMIEKEKEDIVLTKK